MKRLYFFLLGIIATCAAWGQGVNFEPEGTTLEQAAVKAKAAGKLVFMDCYTQWCGPCKKMARDVFPTEEVGAYMNPKFVSIKVDMETAYGAPLAKKLQVGAYPTFVIFNGDGQEIGRFMGSSDTKGFIEQVEKNSIDRGSSAMDERWKNGDRDPEFLMAYLSTLNATYKNSQASEVADAILEGKAETFAADSTLRMIYMRNVSSPFSPAFVYTVKHPEALTEAIGEMPVKMKTLSVLNNYQRELIIEHDGTASLDQEKFDAFVNQIKSLGIEKADSYRLQTLITLSEKQKNLDQYLAYINEYMSNPELDADDMTLARWIRPLVGPGSTEEHKAAVRNMLQQRIADIDSGKRQPMKQVGNMRLSVDTRELLQRILTEMVK